jgi:hypothetical protein
VLFTIVGGVLVLNNYVFNTFAHSNLKTNLLDALSLVEKMKEQVDMVF